MPVRVHPVAPPLPDGIEGAVQDISFPTLGHLLELGFADPDLRRIVGSGRLVGRAVTVRVVAPDSALIHAATAYLTAGDVLVVDTGGDRRHAAVGSVVGTAVAAAGGVGIVVDGPCTDTVELAALGISVYARGTTTLTTKLHALDAGGINIPVVAGGVPVLPGYLVLGDVDGLLLADPSEVLEVIDQARTLDEREPAKLQRLRDGDPLPSVSVAGARLQPLLDRDQQA